MWLLRYEEKGEETQLENVWRRMLAELEPETRGAEGASVLKFSVSLKYGSVLRPINLHN